jgi:3-isopropylmalate/(R)-2-methylmalate dehydratase small subunit
VVDLEQQQLRSSGWQAAAVCRGFAFRRECLLNGWDDIGLTLRHADLIRAFEDQRRIEQPWLFA